MKRHKYRIGDVVDVPHGQAVVFGVYAASDSRPRYARLMMLDKGGAEFCYSMSGSLMPVIVKRELWAASVCWQEKAAKARENYRKVRSVEANRALYLKIEEQALDRFKRLWKLATVDRDRRVAAAVGGGE